MTGPDLRINLEASARLKDIDLMKRELREVEGLMGGLATAAENLNNTGFGGGSGRGRGSGGAPSGGGGGGGGRGPRGPAGGGGRGGGGWGWGNGPGGSNFGIGGFTYSTPMSFGNQMAQALGFGAVLAPGMSIRDALRFNMDSMRQGQSMGMAPAEMLAFNRRQTGFGGLSVRYAYDKQQVFGGATSLATEAAFGHSDRQKLLEDTRLLDPFLRSSRLMGLDPSEAGALEGRTMKAFGMGAEQTDIVAQGFYKGALMAQLPNRGDFMRQTAQFASQIRGMGGSFEEALSLVAGLNKAMPQQFKGEQAQDLLSWLTQTYKQYRMHGPGGFAPPMAGMLTGIFGSSENARQMGATKGISAMLRGLITGVAGQYPGQRFRERFLAGGMGMPDDVALMMDQLIRQFQQNPGMLKQLSADSLSKGGAGLGASGDKEVELMRRDRNFKAAQFGQSIENRAYNASTDLLGGFEGSLKGAIDALKGFTFWLAVAGGANVLSGALQGGGFRGLGGMFGGGAAAAGEGAAAGAAARRFGGGAGISGLLGLLGFGKKAAWKAGDTLTSKFFLDDHLAMSGYKAVMKGEAVTTLDAAGARAMSAAAAKDALAGARFGGSLGKLALALNPVTLALELFATAIVSSTSDLLRTRAEERREEERHKQALAEIRQSSPFYGQKNRGHWGANVTPSDMTNVDAAPQLVDGLSWLYEQAKFGMGWLGGKIGGGWSALTEPDQVSAMAEALVAGHRPSMGANSTYNDHSNITIQVNSAKEAAEVKKSIENAKHKKFAQEQADREGGVNGSGYYSPSSPRNGAPGGLTLDKQM